MEANTNVACSSSTPGPSLELLSDGELLASTRRLVGRTNVLLAELLGHLAEVEARGIHRICACSSLYAYCIYELRFSEDEAFRRVAAARLVKRFPDLMASLAAGELHLTGLLMLGPHLTEENIADVLARAKHRTKRELARLVRALDPLPAVPARIEPLGPAPARVVPSTPTWSEFMQSFCPVRELEPGNRPRDWSENANDTSPGNADDPGSALAVPAVPATADAKPVPPLEPELFKVQFTTSEEYVRLIDEVQALLSHTAPRASLEEIHLRAMRAFVASLKKQKYGARKASGTVDMTYAPLSTTHPQPESGLPATAPSSRAPSPAAPSSHPRLRGRHIPAGVRRAVFERDGQRCTYVDAAGRRCAATRRLEFHHVQPFALGGEHTPENLTLRCAAHNALAAEQDFGRHRIESAKGREPAG